MLMTGVHRLREAGVNASVAAREIGAGDLIVDALVEVTDGEDAWRFACEEKQRTPYPNELPDLDPVRQRLAAIGTPLLALPYVSKDLGGELSKHGWSWMDEVGNFSLRARGLTLKQRTTAGPPGRRGAALPQGSGSLGIMRALVDFRPGNEEGESATGLARQAGVSQPRASQVLHQLADLGLVERTTRRSWVPKREPLVDRFLDDYRGPGGSEASYYSLDGPTAVAERVAGLHHPEDPVLISADVGPDLIVGWQPPSVVVIYTRGDLDLDRLDLVEARGPNDANVLVRAPTDTSVFRPRDQLEGRYRAAGPAIPLVDALQQVWDLQDLGGTARLEVAGRLRTWLLERH